MNRYQEHMMGKPSIETEGCAFCGRPVQSRHHIVPRSQGGKDGPTVTVCGFGNEGGCHGLLHSHRLHLRWGDDTQSWEYFRTAQPTKYDAVIGKDGWKALGGTRWL